MRYNLRQIRTETVILEHFADVLKILEGGLKFNAQTVVNYGRALQRKLESSGDYRGARLIQSKLDGAEARLRAYGTTADQRLPADQDSQLDLATLERLEPGDAHAILDNYTREEVNRFISQINSQPKLEAAGVDISPRMLLFGPPGVGKTQLARHVAAELGLPLITAQCDALISSYLGNTAKNIRRLFQHAVDRPCILFLDEFDALAKARDDAQELGELKRVVVGLLQNIDALPSTTILLAATNHEQLLDEAVWRRFTYRLRLDAPHPYLREALLKSYLKEFAPNVSLQHAVSVSKGFTGAQIRECVDECIRTTILADNNTVDEAQLLRRLSYTALVQRRLTPDADMIARLLLQAGVPQRLAAQAAFISLRQVRNIVQTIKQEKVEESFDGGKATDFAGRASRD